LPNYKSYYRERTKGSWTLTNGENFWAIADTTAESLKVIIVTNTFKMNLVIRTTFSIKRYGGQFLECQCDIECQWGIEAPMCLMKKDDCTLGSLG
jgi:hypothetical protein